MRGLGVSELGGREPQPLFNRPLQSVFEGVRVLLESYAIGIRTVPGAEHPKRDLRRNEVGLGLFDDATKRFEGLVMSIHHSAYPRIERDSAKILEPGHTHSFEATVERRRESL